MTRTCTGLVLGQPEGVVHLARRMLRREIQGREVMEVVLDIGAFRQAEAHLGEDGDHLVEHLHGRVHPAAALGRRRQRQVDPLRGEFDVELDGLQRGLARGDGRGDPVAQAVDHGPPLAALILAHRAQGLEQFGNRPGLAERSDAHALQGGHVGGFCDSRREVGFEFREIGHVGSVLSGRSTEGKPAPPSARRGRGRCQRS
jgi:hypothetical protein